jgi:hypothetical protein
MATNKENSFGSKFKRLFVQEVEDNEKASSIESSTSSNNPQPTQSRRSLVETSIGNKKESPTEVATNKSSVVNSKDFEKSVTNMTAAIQNNIEHSGKDVSNYLDFVRINNNLKAAIPDEKTRIDAALSSIVALNPGITPSMIMKSAHDFLDSLNSEKQMFESETDKIIQEKIDSTDSLLNENQTKIDEYKAQIVELENEIQRLEADSMKFANDISKEKEILGKKRSEFSAAYEILSKEVHQAINTLNNK